MTETQGQKFPDQLSFEDTQTLPAGTLSCPPVEWRQTQITNRPAWNPEFSVTLSLFPRHLPGRCCKHRVLTLDWSPTVDETQVPLPRELTVLWGEMKTPWPSEVWFQPYTTTLLTAGELLKLYSVILGLTGYGRERAH